MYGFSHFWQLCGELCGNGQKRIRRCAGYSLSHTWCFLYILCFFGRIRARAACEYAYNLVLFKEIKRFYIYRDIVGTEAFLLNTAGNVVCFMPFGFFLPIISPRFGKWYLMLILSFLLTLSIETIQLVFKVGSFDVDDMFFKYVGWNCWLPLPVDYTCNWEVSAWDVKQITGFLISASRWQNTAISVWDWRESVCCCAWQGWHSVSAARAIRRSARCRCAFRAYYFPWRR